MITDIDLTPSEMLVLFRKRYDLTQEALAEKLGYNANTIARWEQGGATVKESILLALKGLEIEILAGQNEK